MKRVLVLRKDELLTFGALFRQGLVAVWAPSMLLLLLLGTASAGQSNGHVPIPTAGQLLTLATAPLFWVLFVVFCASRWAKARDEMDLFVWGFLSGSVFVLEFMLVGNSMGVHRIDMGVIVTCVLWGVVHGIAAVIAWTVWRGVCRSRGICMMIQDGHTCPGCAYDLRGNESMVCPECGRGFSLEELGVTGAEFAALNPGE